MVEDEVREILRETMRGIGASSVSVVAADASIVDGQSARDVALGAGRLLRATFPSFSAANRQDLAQEMENAARAVRACVRRWEAKSAPLVAVRPGGGTSKERIVERIVTFLQAFASQSGMDCAAVVKRGELIASSKPLTELENERLAFIVRLAWSRADTRSGTSHGSVHGDDYFAATFYYNAVLVGFYSGPFGADFVRQRAKQVTRELIHLLELLDEPPKDPVGVAPVPPTD